MKELMPLDNLNPVKIFSEGGLDDLLIKIDKEARSHVPDLKTDKGRKAIASMAAKVAKSKTYLDGLGKDLVSDWKNQAKAVDSERKKMRDTLDNLKADVRQPLTEWENTEKERVEKLESDINEMSEAGNQTTEQWLDLPLDAMKDRLEEINNVVIDDSWDEYKDRADEVKEAAISRITKAIEKRETHEQEQAELEKLRKEKIERETKEREDRIAREATEKAEKEAEEKAKIEAERVEREKQQAIEAQQAAERRAVEAEKQAKIDAENAVKAEREKIKAKKAAEKLAAEKREANTMHKKKINNEAMTALVAIGLNEDIAKNVVSAIAKHEIPNVTISY